MAEAVAAAAKAHRNSPWRSIIQPGSPAAACSPHPAAPVRQGESHVDRARIARQLLGPLWPDDQARYRGLLEQPAERAAPPVMDRASGADTIRKYWGPRSASHGIFVHAAKR
jgi:hypothetical protein